MLSRLHHPGAPTMHEFESSGLNRWPQQRLPARLLRACSRTAFPLARSSRRARLPLPTIVFVLLLLAHRLKPRPSTSILGDSGHVLTDPLCFPFLQYSHPV